MNALEKLPLHVQRVFKSANDLRIKGARIWFKWTCQKCGSRQTFEKENTLFTEGLCEECGTITDVLQPAANLDYLCLASTEESVKEVLTRTFGHPKE